MPGHGAHPGASTALDVPILTRDGSHVMVHSIAIVLHALTDTISRATKNNGK